MREKIGALIQFLAVIAAFVLIIFGVAGAYQGYYGNEDLTVAKRAAEAAIFLVFAAVGAGVGIGGVIFGNLLKR